MQITALFALLGLVSAEIVTDSGEEFGILADGWMEVGDHARAVAFYEHAASSRGAYGLLSSLLFSSLVLSCLVLYFPIFVAVVPSLSWQSTFHR